MKILISIISLGEARKVLQFKPDILDIKNPDEGSLGAQFPWVIKDVANEVKYTKITCSATLGDLPYKPGTASLAAFGAASCGADYVKAGLFGVANYEQGLEMMKNIVQSVRQARKNALVVAAGYADYRRFGGISYLELVRIAKNAKTDAVMLDTAIKDGHDLFDAMDFQELKEFVEYSHDSGLLVALAGSLKKDHLQKLKELNPDIIGIRGAVCMAGERKNELNPESVKEFLNYVKDPGQKISV